MAYSILSLLCAAGLLHLVYSYQTFQTHIPNGDKVPNPCNPDKNWMGVGHKAISGAGPRNPFGLLFEENEYTWNLKVCNEDSDNDNRTNGEELGDPNCMWIKGSTPDYSTGLSHPGICEPIDSQNCKEQNDFLNCDMPTEFQCDPVDNDPETFSVNVHLTSSPVPEERTTYRCQVLDLLDPDRPADKDYHMVATTPFIDNKAVMHHALLYGCSDNASIEEYRFSPYECFMSTLWGCNDLIAIWAIGSDGVCFHEDTGFRIGKTGYKKALLELHWDNPTNAIGLTDGSGITIHLTTKLRPYHAGMFMIGQTHLEIPPGKTQHTENSTCSSECTKRKLSDHINIVGALNHMHYLGSAATSQMVSDDGQVTILSHEDDYSFDNPRFVTFDNPLVMEPGYKLQLTCHYDSRGLDYTTSYGEGSDQEMCYAFIMYYPKDNWKGDCVSYGPHDECGVPTYGKDDCDFGALGNVSHPVTKERNYYLYAMCKPGYCADGCLEVVKHIFEEPCFKGENLKIIKSVMGTSTNVTENLIIMDYFYRLDSCNAEIAREQCETSTWKPPVGGAVSTNMASSAFIVFFAIFTFYM